MCVLLVCIRSNHFIIVNTNHSFTFITLQSKLNTHTQNFITLLHSCMEVTRHGWRRVNLVDFLLVYRKPISPNSYSSVDIAAWRFSLVLPSFVSLRSEGQVCLLWLSYCYQNLALSPSKMLYYRQALYLARISQGDGHGNVSIVGPATKHLAIGHHWH